MKILIIKPSSFGDIIQANPVLRGLRNEYPDAEISWLVFDAWAQVPALFPDLDKIIFWKRGGGLDEFLRVLKAVRKERFDIVIDLQGLFRTALAAALSGGKKIIGAPGMKEFSGWFVEEIYPEKKKLNAVRRSLEVIRYLTGKEPSVEFSVKPHEKDRETALQLLSAAGIHPGRKIIGLIPSARGPAKQWPRQQLLKLIEMSLDYSKNFVFVVLGSKGDSIKYNDPRVVDLCGKTTISELAAVLQLCRGVLGPDTGPVHLASALGISVAVIFGGSDVNETAPINGNPLIIRKDFPCSPCRSRPSCRDYKCLAEIKPQEVFGHI